MRFKSLRLGFCVFLVSFLCACATAAMDNNLSVKSEAKLVNSLAVQMSAKVLDDCSVAVRVRDLVAKSDLSPTVERFKKASEGRNERGNDAPLPSISSTSGDSLSDIAVWCLNVQNNLQFSGAVKDQS